MEEDKGIVPTSFKIYGIVYLLLSLLAAMMMVIVFIMVLGAAANEGANMLAVIPFAVVFAMVPLFTLRAALGYFKLKKYVPITINILSPILVLSLLPTGIGPIAVIYILVMTNKSKKLFVN